MLFSSLLSLLLLQGASAYVQLVITTEKDSTSGLNGMWLSKNPAGTDLLAVRPVDIVHQSQETYESATWEVTRADIDADTWKIFNYADYSLQKTKWKGNKIDDLMKKLLYIGYSFAGDKAEIELTRDKDGSKWKFWSISNSKGKGSGTGILTFSNFMAVKGKSDTILHEHDMKVKAARLSRMPVPVLIPGSVEVELPVVAPEEQLYACTAHTNSHFHSIPLHVTLQPLPSQNCEAVKLRLRLPYPQYRTFAELREATRAYDAERLVRFNDKALSTRIQTKNEQLNDAKEQDRISKLMGKGMGKKALGQIEEEGTTSDEEVFGSENTDWNWRDDESVDVADTRGPGDDN